ncbi:MAG: hypothetical protein LBD15_00545 [Holosporales bacterium]|nr:hypothetical protein [Holosporales bacterium]
MNKNVLKFCCLGLCTLILAQTHAMPLSTHPKLDQEAFGIIPGGTLSQIRADSRMPQSLVFWKDGQPYSNEDGQPIVSPPGFCGGGFVPIPFEGGFPKVALLHPYNGRYSPCAPESYPRFMVLDAMRLQIPDNSLNRCVCHFITGHDVVYWSGGPVYFDLAFQTNPFSKPDTIAGKDFILPDDVKAGQRISGEYTEMLFRPQNHLKGNGECVGEVDCFVRRLFGQGFQHPEAARLVGGRHKTQVVLHANGSASPNNLNVSDMLPSGESFIAGSCTYWHPGSVGVEPNSCYYTLHIVLGPRAAWEVYPRFLGPSGAPQPRTFGQVLEWISGLQDFEGMPAEVVSFLLCIGNRPQQ